MSKFIYEHVCIEIKIVWWINEQKEWLVDGYKERIIDIDKERQKYWTKYDEYVLCVGRFYNKSLFEFLRLTTCTSINLPFTEISLAIILDLVQTNQSFMRQSKIDVEKR